MLFQSVFRYKNGANVGAIQGCNDVLLDVQYEICMTCVDSIFHFDWLDLFVIIKNILMLTSKNYLNAYVMLPMVPEKWFKERYIFYLLSSCARYYMSSCKNKNICIKYKALGNYALLYISW